MKRKVAKLRLSPNEEARIIREEHERRRKLRIQQVRDQQRYIALQIRQAVERRRQRQLEQLAEELKQDWEQQQMEKLDTLQMLYQESLQFLGQGHRSAKENEPDLAAIAQREEENHTKAEERYREALKELKSQRLIEHERQSRLINARKKALQTEKERSAKVVSLPPPPPNPFQNIDSRKPQLIKKSDVSSFAGTHYHMSKSTVDRDVNTQQPNAHEEAELEVRRLQDLQKEEKRRREEQFEKARLRGKQALRKEQLVQDRERFLVELEHMQQTDLLRRRQQVSQMSPQIFQPLHKRQETREDFQRQMEFAFEDMYTGERRVNGDLVVQLVPEPLPALSTGSQDQELDITIEEITQHDNEQEVANVKQETSAQVEPSKPAPRRAFKKLLDRIRSQRKQWTDRSNRVPAANSPTFFSDHIPEWDVTIETGSLTSKEKDKLPESAHSPQEQSRAAEHLRPDVTNTIQEFEEELKKREEELEREKQQQMILLQELEEQKVKLEQMLLEAQQEREHLKAAVTQEVPVNQPGAPVCEQEVTSVIPGSPTELESPPGRDEHSRRIREYQQHLLEQNRIHQRSVEVARQRLEEYQRALQIRYSMTSISMQPPVMPSGLSHPPLHSESVHLPALVQLPTAPIEPPYVHDKLKTSVEADALDDALALPPLLPDSCLSIASKFQQDEVTPRNRADRTAWLTDNIMERVTEHLPESVRPSSLTSEPLPYKVPAAHQSAPIPGQQVCDSTQATSPSVTDDAPSFLSGTAAGKPETLSHCSLQTGSLNSRGGDMERQELQEVQRRVLHQREAMTRRQTQEEQQQKQEVEMEEMRQQKETLQALIQTDMQQPVIEAPSDVFPVPEQIGQTRLRLLVSLLRAIEESNGGTLSHLEDPQEEDGFPQQSPSSCDQTGPLPPPRAAKPPVIRVRLGLLERITEQHELSAIQEVETPVDTSQVTGPEDWVNAPSHTADWDLQEESDPSQTSNRTLLTPSLSSRGQQAAERPAGSGTSSRGSGHLIWRERLLMRAESSESNSALRVDSPLSSNSAQGADNSGPVAALPHKSPIQSPHRPLDFDCLSSTTISTGSYITTDPENIEKSPLVYLCGEQGHAADLLDVSSPSRQSSAASCPGVAVDSVFSDSTIQRIIDRYTRELNLSLSTAGRSTDTASRVEEPESSPESLSQQCWVQSSDRRGGQKDSAGQPCLSGTPGTQTSGQERDNTVSPVTQHPEQDSFRPLIGQLTDQSSCLAAHRRDLAMDQLVSHPWAHSSMIGPPPGLPGSVSLDQGGWESTLSRMIGRLSHQPSFHWMSGGQDFYAGQLMEQSTTWLDDGQEESLMRPLVGELDNDGSSGENTHVDVDVSTGASLLSYPALLPDTSPLESPHSEEQTLQNQTSPVDVGLERTEGSDLFHPLLAEVTHNETADPSMTFHLLQHNVPASTEGQATSGGRSVSTEKQADPSPERLRVEKSASHDSSQCSQESVLMLEDTMKADVELTALSLSYLSMCDDTAAQGVSQPTGGTAETNLTPNRPPDSFSFSDLCAEKLKSEQDSNLRKDVPISEMEEVVSEKGILEQSEITLVNLTDTTLQDPETAIPEEEGMWDGKPPDGGWEDRQKGQDAEASTLIPEHRDHTPLPVTFLEFQWGPSRGLQEIHHHEVHHQKLRALLQRSSQRVEDIRARRALVKLQPEIQAPCEAEEPASYKAKTKPEPQYKTNSSKGAGAGAEQPGFIKPKPPLPVSGCRQKGEDEVKIQTPEQRKQDVSEMYQRTQRLYEQLEEVKQQRTVKSRQEASAKNRLKAKEFHKKTLQKLRAKQML